jgi:predicted Fe-Mo cluster-binding NifX family protein
MSLIALTCQNRRDITEHAGRCLNFLIYPVDGQEIAAPRLLELPIEGSLHNLSGQDPHPLDGVDLLISGGMGQGLRAKLGARGIRTLLTQERDPLTAVQRYLQGRLPDEAPVEAKHEHAHHHTVSGCGHCHCGHS